MGMIESLTGVYYHTIRERVQGQRYWRQRTNPDPETATAIHLVLVREPFLEGILTGRVKYTVKQSLVRNVPWMRVHDGDVILLASSACQTESKNGIRAVCSADTVDYWKVGGEEEWNRIRSSYGKQIPAEYWRSGGQEPPKYATVIEFGELFRIHPAIRVIKRNEYRAWIVESERTVKETLIEELKIRPKGQERQEGNGSTMETKNLPTGLVTAEELSERLARYKIDLSPGRLRELVRSGHLPCIHVEEQLFFQTAAVKDWVNRNMLVRQKGCDFPKELKVIKMDPIPNNKSVPKVLLYLKDALHEVPNLSPYCGVYFLIQDDEVIYVGQSVNVPSQIFQHKLDKAFNRVLYLPVPESDLGTVERAFIKALEPRLNLEPSPVNQIIVEDTEDTDNRVINARCKDD